MKNQKNDFFEFMMMSGEFDLTTGEPKNEETIEAEESKSLLLKNNNSFKSFSNSKNNNKR